MMVTALVFPPIPSRFDQRDGILAHFPFMSHFAKQELLVNFSRVFSTMLSSGVPLQESLAATHDATQNEVMRVAIERVQAAVARGEKITGELERSRVFPGIAYDLCAVGEEAGQLDTVFHNLGEMYAEKQAREVELLGKLIQPAIVIVLACVVGFILYAFFSVWTAPAASGLAF